MKDPSTFDEIARTLARPLSRRQAFRYAFGALVGAGVSFLWPKRARAYTNCFDGVAPAGGVQCNNRYWCPAGMKCCYYAGICCCYNPAAGETCNRGVCDSG